MTDYKDVTELYIGFINRNIEQLSKFVNENSRLGIEYFKFNSKKQDLGYNVFSLMSDTFHRENFHSDIIYSLLNPHAKHKEGNVFLLLFLSLLNRFKNCNLDISKYSNAVVYKERHNIDILIKDEIYRTAIIVENKSNNAGDSGKRQIPRYYDTLISEGYTVDAVVYLTLDLLKEPDYSTWTDADIKEVKPKLILLRVYNQTDKNLCSGWLEECIKISVNADTCFIIKQFNDLLKYLGRNIMNKPLMEDFYNSLARDNAYTKALSLCSMIEDMPKFMAERIKDKYENSIKPFKKIWIYKDFTTVFDDFLYEDFHITLDIWCYKDKYWIQLFDRNDDNDGLLDVMTKICCIDDFKRDLNNGKWCRILNINNLYESEAELYLFINSLQEKLESLD